MRTLDSLRILQKDDDGLQALRNLRHDEYLVAWERAYTRPQGRWDDSLAVAALKDVRYAKQRAKQMRADAKKNAKEPKKTSATVASRKKRSPPTAAQTTNATRRKASEILIGTSASERGVSVSGIGESDTQQEGERAAADAVAITPAKLEVSTVAQDEIRVECGLNRLFSTGRDDVGFAELQQELQRGGTIMSVAAIETVLACMQAANKVMHRESRIHLI